MPSPIYGGGISAPTTSNTAFGTSTIRGTNKEVWLTIRTDAINGSGTIEDPFDASTAAKFDTLMRGFVTYTTIHLGPGTFLTNGWQDFTPSFGFIPKEGWKLIGSGRDNTTLKLNALNNVAAGNKSTGLIYGDMGGTPYMPNTEVANLTFDCNGSNLSAGTANGTDYRTEAIYIGGDNCYIHDIRIINVYGHVVETFACVIGSWNNAGGGWNAARNAKIERVLVDQSSVDYGCAIAIFNGLNVTTNKGNGSGIVQGCTVRNWVGTSVFGFMGYNLSFLGNLVVDSSMFGYGDTGDTQFLVFRDNVAIINGGVSTSGLTGFLMLNPNGGATFKQVTVEGNNLLFTPSATSNLNAGLMWVSATGGGGVATNFVLRNNRMSKVGANASRSYQFGNGNDQGIIQGNSYDFTPSGNGIGTAINFIENDSAAYLPTAGGTLTGNLLFTDNTYDIGASGANRPKNLWIAGTANILGTLSISNYVVFSTADWNISSDGVQRIYFPSNGSSYLKGKGTTSVVIRDESDGRVFNARTTGFDLRGTNTNDNASAGDLGEELESLVPIGSPVSLTTTTAANITTKSLTAGDWDVEGVVNFTETTSTVTARVAGISTTSATLPTDGSESYCGVQSTVTTETNSIPLTRKRISLASTTTVYLVGKATFSAGTCGGFGALTARRVR